MVFEVVNRHTGEVPPLRRHFKGGYEPHEVIPEVRCGEANQESKYGSVPIRKDHLRELARRQSFDVVNGD